MDREIATTLGELERKLVELERALSAIGEREQGAGAWEQPPQSRLIDEADLTIDLCTPAADAMCTIDGLDTPVGPGSTIAAVAIVNSIKVRTAQLLVEQRAMPPVITRASVVGAERSRVLFDEAYREHARRLARAIDGGRVGDRATTSQEVKRSR